MIICSGSNRNYHDGNSSDTYDSFLAILCQLFAYSSVLQLETEITKMAIKLLSSIRASNPKKVYLCWTFSEYACVFKSVSDHNPWSFSLYELSAVIFDRENSLSQNGYGLSQGRYWGLISVDWSTSVFKMTQWITNFHQFVPPCFSCLNGTIRSSEQNYFYSPNSCKKHLQVQRVGDN